MFLIEIKKKMKEKPTINFYCMKCNLFFKVDGETLLEDIKCPECETYEIFIELEFDEKIPSYFS
jgi:phage FluMu protein Com